MCKLRIKFPMCLSDACDVFNNYLNTYRLTKLRKPRYLTYIFANQCYATQKTNKQRSVSKFIWKILNILLYLQ